MAVPSIAGQRQTANVAAEQRAIDLATPIVLLEPDAAPLTVVLKRIDQEGRRKNADDPLFRWEEDELETRFDAINNAAGYANNATSLIVDTGGIFPQGGLVIVPRTNEIMYVQSVTANTLTVLRGFAGTTAAALVDNDPLFVISQVAEEGDRSFAARSSNPVQRTNYTQIFRTSVEASGTWISSANLTNPHDWPYQHKKKGIEHLKEIEQGFLFGRPGSTVGPNGKPLRTTGGLDYFCTQNRQDAGGQLTEPEWETWIRALGRYGNKFTVFASPLIISVVNAYAVGKLQTIQSDNDTTYGLAIQEYVSPHGRAAIVKHNLLEGAVWGGMAFGVNFNVGEVQYRYLGGQGAPGASRDTKLLTNRQEADRDGQKDEWLTECGLQLAQPKAHGVLYNVTS
jgi:hypothetical protein